MRGLSATQTITTLGLCSVLLLVLVACQETLLANGAVEQGRQLYTANCASCHGANGEGQPDWRTPRQDGTYPAPPHDSTGHTWHHGDALLFHIVKYGGASLNIPGFLSGMPAFGEQLSDEEVESVIRYLKTLWGANEQAFQAKVTEQERP